MKSGPRPNGTPKRAKASAVEVAPPVNDDDQIGQPNRSPAALEVAILELLEPGPQFKWAIREALHEPEPYLVKHLKILRRAGMVKVVGKILDKRQWALESWQGGPPETKTAPVHVTVTKTSKLRAAPCRPASATIRKDEHPHSWWVAAPREHFTQQAVGAIVAKD